MRKALICLAGLAVLAASLSACAQPVSPVPLASRSVTYGHVQIDLPPGWTTGHGRTCGAQPDTVEVQGPGPRVFMSCPTMIPPKNPVKMLTVTSLYDPSGARGWTGTPINWEGQQAWLVVEPAPKPHMSAYASLTLPWLNTQVSVTAADVATARALLDNVHVRPATTLEVPTSADTVQVNSVNGLPPVRYPNPDLASKLLADLRALPIETPSAICAKALMTHMAAYTTLTFTRSGTQSVFMIPRGGCQQVTSGTGVVAHTNHQFWLDFDSSFGNPRFGGPVRATSQGGGSVGPPPAPKNAYHFDADSFMYPAPAGATPRFTRKQLGTALAFWNGATVAPQTLLVMATGGLPGNIGGQPRLMWVVRYPNQEIPNYGPGCGRLNGTALAQCEAAGPPSHADLYAFYDAYTGVRLTSAVGYSALQTLTFTSKPGWPAIDQWVAKYPSTVR